MKRRPLASGAIASAGYDPALAVLELEFTSGEVYQYYAVPPSVHRALLQAESAGRFFRDSIRDVYPVDHRRPT
ncbi:KTSC domain-containing protein [Microbacterium sp. SSM24]|uniref:KTSC domain-containing protein n=1 Tax=Microbacterium sp. SSM24 TaxID=2991714 RepID=UPI002227507E|nr:KTSC domain-containing protein [Microbacterium sp. SSM24]MCW3494549.1 KTSC domain-containing protein [Microbacterium sp. SSM24]